MTHHGDFQKPEGELLRLALRGFVSVFADETSARFAIFFTKHYFCNHILPLLSFLFGHYHIYFVLAKKALQPAKSRRPRVVRSRAEKAIFLQALAAALRRLAVGQRRFLFLDLCIRFGKIISKVCEGSKYAAS